MGVMFVAILICSDESCDSQTERVGSLEELDRVLCDGCGCLMQVVALEQSAEEAQVVTLHPPGDLSLAA